MDSICLDPLEDVEALLQKIYEAKPGEFVMLKYEPKCINVLIKSSRLCESDCLIHEDDKLAMTEKEGSRECIIPIPNSSRTEMKR